MVEQYENREEVVAEGLEDEVMEEARQSSEELEREVAQLSQQLLRLRADFENYRRRSREQMEDLVLAANEKLLQDLLPVLDNFERALETKNVCASEQDPFYQGMAMVQQGLLHTLSSFGLEPIIAVGMPFDPTFHDAISMEGEGGEDLVVLHQVQTGYILNGKVLRHTKVLVGQHKEEDECQK